MHLVRHRQRFTKSQKVLNVTLSALTQVMDAMASLASGPVFMSVDANPGMGFNVEGEVVFDKTLKPLKIEPLKIFGSNKFSSSTIPSIPPDSNR